MQTHMTHLQFGLKEVSGPSGLIVSTRISGIKLISKPNLVSVELASGFDCLRLYLVSMETQRHSSSSSNLINLEVHMLLLQGGAVFP